MIIVDLKLKGLYRVNFLDVKRLTPKHHHFLQKGQLCWTVISLLLIGWNLKFMPVRIWQTNRQLGKMPFNRWVQGLACQGTSMFMKLEHQGQFLPKKCQNYNLCNFWIHGCRSRRQLFRILHRLKTHLWQSNRLPQNLDETALRLPPENKYIRLSYAQTSVDSGI